MQWNDERGFGFIRADTGERYFVHISEIGRIATRPRVGDRLSFVPKRGEDGRLQAASVRISAANPLPERPIQRGGTEREMPLDWRLPLAAMLAGLILVGSALDQVPLVIALAYLGAGLISFFGYWVDKRAARAGHWRTSEAMLHGIDLCFGIVGGLMAQTLLRHKTRKSSFVLVTALIVIVHLLGLVAMLGGLIDFDLLRSGLPLF